MVRRCGGQVTIRRHDLTPNRRIRDRPRRNWPAAAALL